MNLGKGKCRVAANTWKAEVWRHTSGTWSLVAIITKMDLNLRKVTWTTVWWNRGFARVKALTVAALTIEVCSRKKRKVSRPSELEMILLGYYIEFGPRDQEPCIYFGKSSCNTGNRIGILACVYTKIWEGERGNSKLLGLCHQGID